MTGRSDLVLFPCSAEKKGSPPSQLAARPVSAFLTKHALDLLQEGRRLACARPRARLDLRSEPVSALTLYTGNPYRVPGFRGAILEALRREVHCLIVSGGYGLVRPDEPIHYYEAHIQHTAGVWRRRLPAVLADYIRQNSIGRVFVACSAVYARVLCSDIWTAHAEKVYWCIPRLPPGTGGAQVLVPKLVGEAVVALIAANLTPDNRWHEHSMSRAILRGRRHAWPDRHGRPTRP